MSRPSPFASALVLLTLLPLGAAAQAASQSAAATFAAESRRLEERRLGSSEGRGRSSAASPGT